MPASVITLKFGSLGLYKATRFCKGGFVFTLTLMGIWGRSHARIPFACGGTHKRTLAIVVIGIVLTVRIVVAERINLIEHVHRLAFVPGVHQFTVRGVPVTYYGEEIGMQNGTLPTKTSKDPVGRQFAWVPGILLDWLDLPVHRDRCRIPMQWNDGPNAGFCGQDATPWLPVHENYKTINVKSELADEHTRTSRLEITVDNRERLLRSGQIVRARLTRRVLNDVIMIPLGSVIPLERGRVVYVVEGGQAQRRLVELGFIKGRSVQILAGVEAGDLLIVAGHRFVGPGQPVTIVSDERPAAQTSLSSSVPPPADSP